MDRRPLSSEAKGILAAFLGRITIYAALIHVVYVLFFWAAGAPLLVWVNLGGLLIFVAVRHLLHMRRLRLAVTLFWVEVLPHVALGTLTLGWDSGYHYALLMFVPFVALTGSRRQVGGFTGLLLLLMLSLEVLQRELGPLAPIPEAYLLLLKWFNLVMLVLVLSVLTTLFRRKIADAERSLLALATVDPLTGLHNRHYFEKAWSLAWAQQRRAKGTLCLLMVDLDHFKQLNDTHGHQAGDRMLIECGRIFGEAVRDIDTLARWGGEEFALLLPGANLSQSMVVAERMRVGIEALVVIHQGTELRCTASVGLTEMLPADTLDQMIMRADQALYTSKMAGRNCVHSV
jgi:diguanylate cyclase (GGDEF)-like protein